MLLIDTGLNNNIQCHVSTFSVIHVSFVLRSQITKLNIMAQVKWEISLMIAAGHFNLSWGFMLVSIGIYIAWDRLSM